MSSETFRSRCGSDSLAAVKGLWMNADEDELEDGVDETFVQAFAAWRVLSDIEFGE